MKKIVPLDQEALFKLDELFFSVTDKRGLILFGNDVFLRVSGYPKEKIIGAPHNIIRHPDMPKAVFKLFWDTLKQDKSIGAYVKNLSADGCFYWVFAFAFPIKEGYLSIRFKPTSALFKKVQALYKQVLEFESQKGIGPSSTLLLELICAEGFKSYDEFMIAAAIEELKSMDLNLKKKDDNIINEEDSTLRAIVDITRVTSQELNLNFKRIEEIQSANVLLQQCVNDLESKFQGLSFLSLNMQISSTKHGDHAKSLNVVSLQFSNLAIQASTQLKPFFLMASQLSDKIKTLSLELGALKLQMLMVDFFVRESMVNFSKDPNAFSSLIENQNSFCSLYSASIQKIATELGGINYQLNKLTRDLDEVQQLTNGLEVVKQVGGIESARNDEVKKEFEHYLNGMKEFIELLKASMNVINKEIKTLIQLMKNINESSSKVSKNVEVLFDLALKMPKS